MINMAAPFWSDLRKLDFFQTDRTIVWFQVEELKEIVRKWTT